MEGNGLADVLADSSDEETDRRLDRLKARYAARAVVGSEEPPEMTSESGDPSKTHTAPSGEVPAGFSESPETPSAPGPNHAWHPKLRGRKLVKVREKLYASRYTQIRAKYANKKDGLWSTEDTIFLDERNIDDTG